MVIEKQSDFLSMSLPGRKGLRTNAGSISTLGSSEGFRLLGCLFVCLFLKEKAMMMVQGSTFTT